MHKTPTNQAAPCPAAVEVKSIFRGGPSANPARPAPRHTEPRWPGSQTPGLPMHPLNLSKTIPVPPGHAGLGSPATRQGAGIRRRLGCMVPAGMRQRLPSRRTVGGRP